MSFEARQNYAQELLKHLNMCRFNFLPYYDDQVLSSIIESIAMNNHLNYEPDIPSDDTYETLFDYTYKEDNNMIGTLMGNLNVNRLTEQAKLCYKNMIDGFIDQYEFFQSNHYTHCHIHIYETQSYYLLIMSFTKKLSVIDSIEQKPSSLQIKGYTYTEQLQGCKITDTNSQDYYFALTNIHQIDKEIWAYEINIENQVCPILPLTVIMATNFKISMATVSLYCNNEEILVQDLQEQKSSLSISSCALAKKLQNRQQERGIVLNKSRLVDKAQQIVSQKQSGFEQEFQKKSITEKQFGNLFKIEENYNEYLISSAKHPMNCYSSIIGESQMISNITMEPEMFSKLSEQSSFLQLEQQPKIKQTLYEFSEQSQVPVEPQYQRIPLECQQLQQQQIHVEPYQQLQFTPQQSSFELHQQQEYLNILYLQQQQWQQQMIQQQFFQQPQLQIPYYQLQYQQQQHINCLSATGNDQIQITDNEQQQSEESEEILESQQIQESESEQTNKNRLSYIISSPSLIAKRRSSLQKRQSIHIQQKQEDNLRRQGGKLLSNKSQQNNPTRKDFNFHPLDFSDLRSNQAQRKMQELLEFQNFKQTVQSFKPLYKNEKLSDFTLSTQDSQFKLHKSVLVQVSPFFKKIIDSNANSFHLEEKHFDILLKYIYYGQLSGSEWMEISIQQASSLFSMGNKFGLHQFLIELISRVIIPKMQIKCCIEWIIRSQDWILLQTYAIKYFSIYSKQILQLSQKYYRKLTTKQNEQTFLANKYISELWVLSDKQLMRLLSESFKVIQDYDHLESLLWLLRERLGHKTNEELLESYSSQFDLLRDFKFKDFTESVLEDHQGNQILFYPTRKEKNKLKEFASGSSRQDQSLMKPNSYTYELILLDIPKANDAYIVSETFKSDSNNWRLILEIDDKGLVSVYLQDRGVIQQYMKSNFLSVRSTFEFLSENGNTMIQSSLYHSYPQNQFYSVGLGNIITLTGAHKIHLRVTIQEDYIHSALLTWMAHNFKTIEALPKWEIYSILCSDMLNVESEDQVLPILKKRNDEYIMQAVRFTFVDLKLVFSLAKSCEPLRQSKVFQEILSQLVDGTCQVERSRKLYRYNAERERKSRNFRKDLVAWLLEAKRESMVKGKEDIVQEQKTHQMVPLQPAKRSISQQKIEQQSTIYSKEIVQAQGDKENFQNNCVLI